MRTMKFVIVLLTVAGVVQATADERPRARDVGLTVGIFPTGALNAITDVGGVRVGHATFIEGEDLRTGVTAIIPAAGNLYTHPVLRLSPGRAVSERVREFCPNHSAVIPSACSYRPISAVY